MIHCTVSYPVNSYVCDTLKISFSTEIVNQKAERYTSASIGFAPGRIVENYILVGGLFESLFSKKKVFEKSCIIWVL